MALIQYNQSKIKGDCYVFIPLQWSHSVVSKYLTQKEILCKITHKIYEKQINAEQGDQLPMNSSIE